jgi:hypothetical protein
MLHKLTVGKVINRQSEEAVKKLVDRIIFTRKLSRQDHSLLTASILANGDMSEGYRRQVNRIFDCIQSGQLKLVDW